MTYSRYACLMGSNTSYCPHSTDALQYDGNSLCLAVSLQYIPQVLFLLLSIPTFLYLHRKVPSTRILHLPLHAVRWTLILALLLALLAESGQTLMVNLQLYGGDAAPVGFYLPLFTNFVLVIVSYFVAYAVETRERPCFLMVLVLTWTCSCATRAVLIHEYRSWPDSLKDDVRPTTCYVVMTFYVLLLFADSYVVIVR